MSSDKHTLKFQRVQRNIYLCFHVHCSNIHNGQDRKITLRSFSEWQDKENAVSRPAPGDLSDPGIEPVSLLSPALADGFFTTSTTQEACTFTPRNIIQSLKKRRRNFSYPRQHGWDLMALSKVKWARQRKTNPLQYHMHVQLGQGGKGRCGWKVI